MKRGEHNTTLGNYITTRRLAAGLSIVDAQEHSGLDDSYWRKVEAGHYQSPDAKTLRRIAETISCPLEDLYNLCGYTVAAGLPTLTPYLRSKYDLPPEAIADMEKYFALLRSFYVIPADQAVFPPAASTPTKPARGRPSSTARNRPGHPWREL